MNYVENRITVPLSKAAIQEIPTTSGVYFFTREGTIYYIGKSVNLKARLLSHLENAKLDQKEHAIVSSSDTIEYIVTDSEFNALLLESHLIQKYKPQYNSRWRDDKSYLYVKITKEQSYPKIFSVRAENDGTSLYFGPFPSHDIVEEILREIRKIYPFCTQKKIGKHSCFYSKIGLCDPCPSNIEKMSLNDKRKYKRQYRNNIRQIVRIFSGETELVLKSLYQELSKLSKEKKYEEAMKVRDRIKRLEFFLVAHMGARVETLDINQSEKAVQELTHILSLYFPNLSALGRIECYDISNTSQKEATASMVVMSEGLTDKSQYRRFKIKNKKIQSDFEMMDEVFRRRFKNKWQKPDLIVVDGGKPQVRTVYQVLASLEVDIPLIGIAKHPDRLVMGLPDLPMVRPAKSNLGFRLIQQIRDEAHRFAKKYHVFLRNKKML